MHPVRKLAIGGALTGAAVAGGAVGASLLGTASAQTPGTTSTTTAASSSATSTHPDFPAHGSAAPEDQEKAVTGTNATKAQQAAVASVGSGTAGAVTTDFTGTGYEVTVTKAEGTQVKVRLDSSFTVQQGGPGGPGGHGGPDNATSGAPAAWRSPGEG